MAVKVRQTNRRPVGWLENVPLWTFGHSYVSGAAAGSLAKNLIGRQNMGAYSTRGSAGSTAGQMSAQIQGVGGAGTTYSNALTGLVVLMSLINDVNGSYPTSTVVEAYRAAFAQLWGYFITYTTSQFAFGTGWSTGVTTTAGSFFDFTWYGDTGYILASFQSGAAINLTITNSGTGNTTAQTPNIGGYGYTFPGVIKLGGYGPGKHTVRVTLTSGAGMTVYGGVWQNPYPPQVLWAREGAITAYSGAQNTLLTATYPAGIEAILADFPNVTEVPFDGNWNNATMEYSDGVHPNQKGFAYWNDLIEAAAYKLGYQPGMSNMFAYPSGNYATAGSLVSASFPAANYITGTIPATSFTHLKTWSSAANYVYALSPDPDFGTSLNYVGANLVITSGTGWTPGTYVVFSQSNSFGTPDGTHTMLEVTPCPALYLPSGAVGTPPAAAGTTGGAGFLSP